MESELFCGRDRDDRPILRAATPQLGMTSYILLKLAVTINRIIFAILQFVQRHFKYETDWQNAWGRWTMEYTIRSTIGSPDIRVSSTARSFCCSYPTGSNG